MATQKKISTLYNSITNPAGGLTTSPFSFPKTGSAQSTAPSLIPSPYRNKNEVQNKLLGLFNGGQSAWLNEGKPAPVQSPTTMSGAYQGPVAPQKAPATPAPVETPQTLPAQWMKADGSIKTPDEVAADIALTLKNSNSRGNGDIGTLAGNEFGGGQKTAEQLRAEATQINNARNDIAVGANDPYKVAAQSGIAYTPQELQAIEKAYAGIYDPALTTAMAKVESKQLEDKTAAENKARLDEIRLSKTLDNEAPYTLGKDQVRYDGQGNPVAVGLSSDTTMSGQYTPGADPTVDAYIKGIRSGTYKPSDVPEEYKALVAQGMSVTQPPVSQTSTDAISVINELVEKDLENLSGWRITDPSSLWPGSDVQKTQNLAKQLSGILSLDNRKMLQGSGAISDFEFRVLGDASSALGIDENGRTNLSPTDFKAELEKLKLKLEVGDTSLTDDELLHLRDTGYTPKEIREFSQQQSFNSVGNTTASIGAGNRPQRNNNPGNVKSGGLSDSLAVGTDDQGHLIFPDADAGFKALQMDLTAKVNGSSRYLSPNPTIEQLGKVYAEDPNWPIRVAQILGVPPTTGTQTIPIDKLAKAIATQEGFYA